MAADSSDLVSGSNPAIETWLRRLAGMSGNFSALLAASRRSAAGGFEHTLREICQQPVTWTETVRRLLSVRMAMAASVASCRRIVLTGSGSSQYAGECAAPFLRSSLGRSVTVAGGGDLLLSRGAAITDEPTLLVSLARSGESPESVAVVESLLETEPQTRHLIITCNAGGTLAREFAGIPRVTVVSLGDEVNDRSLVMTSSFTNLVLGASFLGWLDRTDEFAASVDRVSHAGEEILESCPDRLADLVPAGIERIVFLGSGSRFGAAREGALKLLEMTAGRVATMAETYLGLRHGPMCFIDHRTLIVCFQSADPVIRRYEDDLISELHEKQLGATMLFAGVEDPVRRQCGPQDACIAYRLPDSATDDDLVLLDAMLAQILGFHRCRLEGLSPDSPSVDGIISRVVREFQIHRAELNAHR
jgi:tagatose-6-phosphate ketose/aldose isomerase